MAVPSELRLRAEQYLSLHGAGAKVSEFLGHGTDGAVWATSRETAVKVFERDHGYLNERDAYQRLADFGATEKIEGFWVPEMQGYDDDLMVVEMDLMRHPPYIIDFAKVMIDRSPDFSKETLRDSEEQGLELFEQKWPTVKLLLAALESYQIYYLDPKPYNIVFTEAG